MALDRDEFRNLVFQRDGHKCVICKETAQDAHHIVERRLWNDGGYHLNNGASLCGYHHLCAEATTISCQEIRDAAGIKKVIMPDSFRDDEVIDKWGDGILPDGKRTKGPLFNDESVQKILAPVLHLFTNWVKYPRTFHLPFSPGVAEDDKIISDLSVLQNAKRLIATVKLDGENSTLYHDYFHARSLDSRGNFTRHWLQNFHATIRHDIPEGWRVCGENLWAKHAIHYQNLETYFYGFSVWNDKNMCLSWDETLEWFGLLGIKPVPVIYDGTWNESVFRDLWKPQYEGNEMEGFVVRVADAFLLKDFGTSLVKWVRADHVVKNEHWLKTVIRNELETKTTV